MTLAECSDFAEPMLPEVGGQGAVSSSWARPQGWLWKLPEGSGSGEVLGLKVAGATQWVCP